jgi:hypothetical protein
VDFTGFTKGANSMIYQYCRSAHFQFVFEDKTMRFTQPQFLNDPEECKPSIKGLMNIDSLNNLVKTKFEDILDKELSKLDLDPFKRAIKKYEQLSSITQYKQLLEIISQSPPLTTTLESAFKRLEKLIGIACFSEDGNSIEMWKRYGGSGHGFMLEFNEAHDFFDTRKSNLDSLRLLTNVSYENEKHAEFLTGLKDKNVFYTKNADKWAVEKERRLIRSLSDLQEASEGVFVDHFPFSVLESFTFGTECSDKQIAHYTPQLRDENPNINVYRLRFIKNGSISKEAL